MRFELSIICFMLVLSGLFAGCTKSTSPAARDEYQIGNAVDSVSSIVAPDGSAGRKIAIFDPTIRMIHHFELAELSYRRTMPVRAPGEEHFVIYDEPGDYVIDLSSRNLTITTSQGRVQNDPLSFAGKPRSIAFRQGLGAVVICDDTGTVGLLRLERDGTVISKRILGPIMGDDVSIASGDLTDDGRLVLALSDNSITIVDIEKSIDENAWHRNATFASGLSGIAWVAPVRGKASQILVKAAGKVSLLDIDQRLILDSYDSSSETTMLYSKAVDPHVLLWSDDSRQIKLVYPNANKLGVRTKFQKSKTTVLSSLLDLAADSWSFIATLRGQVFDGKTEPVDQARERFLERMTFKTGATLPSRTLPDGPRLRLAKNSVFALFISDLGRAENFVFEGNDPPAAKGFNLPYIR